MGHPGIESGQIVLIVLVVRVLRNVNPDRTDSG